MGSEPFKLSGADGKKLLKGAGIALGGSLLAYTGQQVLPALSGTSMGWLAPLGAVIINMLLKWLTDTRQ